MLGDEAGDQARGGDVEAEVARPRPLGHHAAPAPAPLAPSPRRTAPRPRRAPRSGWRRRRASGEVDGGGGERHVEGDAVVVRRQRLQVGADLVGRVAVGGHPVGADDHQVHHPLPHQVAAGVVHHHRVRDAVLAELEGGERGALVARPRLVHPDVEREAARRARRRRARWRSRSRWWRASPALQWVSTRTSPPPRPRRDRPQQPQPRLADARASAPAPPPPPAAPPPAPRPPLPGGARPARRLAPRARTAQRRFTAVGRVASSAAAARSSAASSAASAGAARRQVDAVAPPPPRSAARRAPPSPGSPPPPRPARAQRQPSRSGAAAHRWSITSIPPGARQLPEGAAAAALDPHRPP